MQNPFPPFTMTNGETISQNEDTAESVGSDADSLTLLTTALASYLEEVDDYCRICLRHDGATAVSLIQKSLRLTRLFPWRAAIEECVVQTAERLPSWQESPFWKADGKTWVRLDKTTLKQ